MRLEFFGPYKCTEKEALAKKAITSFLRDLEKNREIFVKKSLFCQMLKFSEAGATPAPLVQIF